VRIILFRSVYVNVYGDAVHFVSFCLCRFICS